MDDKKPVCSQCGRTEKEAQGLMHGKAGAICEHCATLATVAFKKAHFDADKPSLPALTGIEKLPRPSELFARLGEYVIGQDHAKKVLSVAVYNHYKRVFNPPKSGVEMGKSNMVMIGPTGTGKTLLVQTLARFVGVPLAIGDATTLTEAGYVGEDVESLLLKLLCAADMNLPLAEVGIVYIDEIDKIRRTNGNVSLSRDVSGEGVQRGLLKMVEGTVANIPPAGGRKHPEQKYIALNTANVLFIVGGAFVGLDEVVARRKRQRKIGFGGTPEADADKEALYREATHEDLIQYGMMPELVGRLPVLTTLDSLSMTDMIRILTEPKNALIRQYQEMVQQDGCALDIRPSAIEAIAQRAKQHETGARALRSICESLFLDIMFTAPDNPGKTFVITDKVVRGEDKP